VTSDTCLTPDSSINGLLSDSSRDAIYHSIFGTNEQACPPNKSEQNETRLFEKLNISTESSRKALDGGVHYRVSSAYLKVVSERFKSLLSNTKQVSTCKGNSHIYIALNELVEIALLTVLNIMHPKNR
jgi:hypothetical protein